MAAVGTGPHRRAAYLATAMGMLHALLALLSFWLLHDVPKPGSSDADLVAYYSGSGGRTVLIVGIYLLPVSAIAFIWFTVALRMWISQHGHPEHFLFSNLQLVAGIVYAALLLVAAAAFSVDSAVARLTEGPVNPQSARAFPQFGRMLAVMLDSRMAAIFVMTTAGIGRSTKVLPSWFVWLSYPLGLLLLFGASLETEFALVFPAWITVLAVLLILRVRRSAESRPGDPVTGA
ncbi:hypothetical protein [Catellatospora sichuanensis]|uniref:hypothetical protein n=1 Tax=Catellatospora sichuanensis TaxID=1969805 RepID=UPI0011832BA7|nr:hypothetical protein [Catellatospora sichuanensis]